jgi:hypothetical protein
MTDYAGLKTEIALPKYQGMTDAQIATSLTTPFAITVDVPAVEAFNILQRSSTGDWGKLVARSQQLLSGNPIVMPSEDDPRAVTPPANNDVAIVMAKNITSTYNVERTLLQSSNPADAAAMQRQLTVLQASGDVSKASADAILALPNKTTTRAAQLGFGAVHDMTQEIAAARKWTP